MKWIGAIHGFAAIAVIALLAFFPPSTWAGFEEGVRAYKTGDYATALKEIRPLAEQGHPKLEQPGGFRFVAAGFADGMLDERFFMCGNGCAER